jgi:hypothetical protein
MRDMADTNPLNRAIDISSRAEIARACDVSYPAVIKWQRAGRLPKTDHMGLTRHARNIAAAVQGQVSESDLLSWSLANWRA